MGRCVLSRLLYGGRTTLGIVLVGAALVTLLGTVVGLVMGSNKNGRNIFLESVLNAVTAIPPMAYLSMGQWHRNNDDSGYSVPVSAGD